MNEVYNGGFAPEFSVSMLKETIALVYIYIYIYIYINSRIKFETLVWRQMKGIHSPRLALSESGCRGNIES